MTLIDDIMLPQAKDLLDTYGKPATWRELSPTYDDETRETTFGAATEHTVSVSPPSRYTSRLVDGDLIQAGDMQTILAGQNLPFTPTEGKHELQIDNDVWRVVSVNPVRSGKNIAIWKVQLRK